MSASLPNKPTASTVSVIIPFFNRADFLSEAVESVLAQTYSNWELILVDDGSTDTSPEAARRFVQKHPKKVFLYSHENGINRGASSSRNLGIKHATGDLITFLDSDDVFLPETLEIAVGAFDRNTEANVVCGTLQYWFSWSDQQNKTERDFMVNLGLPANTLYEPPSLLVHNLRAGGRKPGIGSVVLKSDLAKQFDMFEEDFAFVCEDQVFWAKLSMHAKIYVLKDCLAKYRQHPSSSVSALMKHGDINANWRQFAEWLEKYLVESSIDSHEIRQALQVFQKENSYRVRFHRLLRLYHRVLPYHIRYRIRDVIISWRTPKTDLAERSH
jgi:glycosyltransferase involved in cell wall biosynthesis